MSLTCTFVHVVCELLVTVMLHRTVSRRLTLVTGTDGADASATPFEIVSAAVCTFTPVVSVPESVPTLVATFAVLKNVPPVVPALTVKMNVRVELAGMVVPPGIVHVTVPLAPADGVVDGTPSVPEPVLTYVKPEGSVSVTEETLTTVLEVLLSVSVQVTGWPCWTSATSCVFVTVGGGTPQVPPIVTF